MAMRKRLEEYLSFDRRERNGILILLTLILLLLIYLRFGADWFSVSAPDAKEQARLDSLLEQMERSAVQASDSIDVVTEAEFSPENDGQLKTALFEFDPNTIGLQEWQMLGLSARQTEVILNYIRKGGRFNSPADLQKMYSITPEKFVELSPYIRIVNNSNAKHEHLVSLVIDLNEADSALLVSLKGIGPVFASRIIKYRNLIGGYYSVDQLSEVYGMDAERLNAIRNKISVSADNIRKIDLNKAKESDMKKHPYIGSGLARAIVRYREQHGLFSSVDQLKNIKILEESDYNRLKPYLSLE